MPAHLEEQEREIAGQAEAVRGRSAELIAQLEEFAGLAEEVRITRRTLPAMPDPSPPTPPATRLPDHPGLPADMAVFAAADAPLRGRAVCEAMDLEIASGNVDNVRLKLERLVELGILIEQGAGVVHPAAAVATRRGHHQPDSPSSQSQTGSTSLATPSGDHPVGEGKLVVRAGSRRALPSRS
ncbi:hypothetical protein [Streptomyces sp. NPDC002588]|uniref:hypothetical protein n=1 Tax=Streptomyces sp. NPDC002588 TaxID=3154419 RepID=UPI00331FE705